MDNIADYAEENTMEILLFGHCAYMFAQLLKNCVLVSWLLSTLLWDRYNICSFWQANRCVGTWRTTLCGNMKNKPPVFINPVLCCGVTHQLYFFFCSSKLVSLTQSILHSSSVLQKGGKWILFQSVASAHCQVFW